MSGTEETLGQIEKNLHNSMLRDRYSLLKKIRHARRQLKENPALSVDKKMIGSVESLEKKLEKSVRKRSERKKKQLQLNFNPDLPVTDRKDEIIDAIKHNQVVIISGETGSGKTTQLPKFCIAAGRGAGGMIACTQPRRIAAVTVANRLAEEINEETGDSVGYKIRFRDKTADSTFIKVMTDGILLAEAQADRFLNDYDTIIVDEAHERSLNIDFILGILRTLVKKRKDLKVIITSATIDTEKFSKAFDGAPVIEVSGRTYPVEVIYKSGPDSDDEMTFVDMAVKAVEDIQGYGPYGDILIFMPTEADIRETCELLGGRKYLNATILPLYARLSAGEQKRIFSPAAGRKIVVATNVAETSITIPGIKYVIDTGFARIPQYTPRTRTTSLPVMSVSKSSADQRKGRCGRVENGVCIRLFDEKDYESRPLFTAPEILRANLAEVILRMISLRLGSVDAFPFIDPPAPKSIRDGFDTLVELGAIKPTGKKGGKHKQSNGQEFKLTDKGKVMARLPVDPKLSRMLIEAEYQGCLEDVTVIIAALSIRDPRERPADKTQQADQMHAVFKDPYSDFISLLNIWKAYNKELEGSKSLGKLKKFCKKYFLSFLRMREWRDIHHQLSATLKEHGFKNRTKLAPECEAKKNETFGPAYKAIHKSVLAGYLSGIAFKKEKNMFSATRGREAMIFPGSGLFNKAGQWVVAAELVETSRLYARNVANIDNGWLEELGKGNCKYTYSNPRWEKKKGAVVAHEQVTLFGLVIVSGRTVMFGKTDPEEATKIFVRSALVEGDVNTSGAEKELSFLKHNLELVENVRDLEDRVRRRDILVSEEDMYEFYMDRLETVYDIRTLVRYIKKRGGSDFLKMTPETMYRYTPESVELERYPESLTIGDNAFSCTYSFQPGKEKDGVTLTIPTHVVPSVSPESLDWLVPGLVREKIETMIKALPKEYRKKLVPVTNTVDIIEREMEGVVSLSSEKSLPEASLVRELGSFIYQRFGINIPASAWSTESLPDHLKMRVSITSANGKEVASGRDRSILVRDYSETVDQDQFKKARRQWERDRIESWDFGTLKETLTLKGDMDLIVFPALSVEGENIALRLSRDRRVANDNHIRGVKALYEKQLSKHLKGLKKDLALKGQIKNYTNYFGGEKTFSKMMYHRVVSELFLENIRSEEAFLEGIKTKAPLIYPTGQKLVEAVTAVLESFHEARAVIYQQEIKAAKGGAVSRLTEELRAELEQLVPDSFVELYDYQRISGLGRLIKAVKIRAERGFVNPEKDSLKSTEVKPFKDALNRFLKKLSPDTAPEAREMVETFFWMIEEYKVSVFAQELKTPVKISKKRLEKMAGEITRIL